MDKIVIYLARVCNVTRLYITESLGFIEGKLPLRYLVIPFDSKKVCINKYLPLVESITFRVIHWFAKLLSYAGRVKLIKSFVFGIKTY